jgi:hypothetical protein
MFAYSALRDKLLQLTIDLTLNDEELLDGCSQVGREFEAQKRREAELLEEKNYLDASLLLQQQIVSRAWALLMRPISYPLPVPLFLIEMALCHLIQEGSEVWFPRSVYLSFGDPVPCSYGRHCPYNDQPAMLKEFEGKVYVHLLHSFDLAHSHCNKCRSFELNSDAVAKNMANELVAKFREFAKKQPQEDLSPHVLWLLSDWLSA